MFKVECLGCQAPYQVDERRVPEKGLKMRCPKCGTTFKVEPPAPGTTPSQAPAPEPEPAAAKPSGPPLHPFTSAGIDPARKLNKPPGGRDSLARTMIGVSSAEMDQLKDAAAQAAAKPKAFRIPRPSQGPERAPPPAAAPAAPPTAPVDSELPATPAQARSLGLSAASGQDDAGLPALPGTAPARSLGLSAASGQDDAGLPALPGTAPVRSLGLRASFGQDAALPELVKESRKGALPVPVLVPPSPRRASEVPRAPSATPAAKGWLDSDDVSEAPASLPEEEAPLTLSDLPQPVAARQRSVAVPTKAPDKPAPLELDFEEDLPIAASPQKRPPPRRPRQAQAEAAEPADDPDLPARPEAAGAGLPAVASPPARPPERAPRPPSRQKADDLDLPAIAPPAATAARSPAGAPKAPAPKPPAPKPAAAKDTLVDLPSARAARAEGLSDRDLPAIGKGLGAGPPRAPAPSNDFPDVLAASVVSAGPPPAADLVGLPEVLSTGLPTLAAAGLPAVPSAGLPAVSPAGLPAMPSAGLPARQASGLPAVSSAGLPSAVRIDSDLPGVFGGGLPAVSSAGLRAVSGSALPVVSPAGLPEVRAAGLPRISDSGLPDVLGPGLPQKIDSGLPDVLGSDLPDVYATGLPLVADTGLPDVLAAGLPEISAGLPDVLAAGLPTASAAGLPEVFAAGVSGFGRVDLPVSRPVELPDLRAGGIGEMDLPGVGESLPSVAESWGNLPSVGETLPTAKSSEAGFFDQSEAPFEDFGAGEGDPFAGSEADFGAPEDDPFAVQAGAASDQEFAPTQADDDAPVGAPTAGAGYGEVNIAGEAAGAALETDDMEFQAIPQRGSAVPGRAAASASVHAEGLDAEAAGSTLELGPERKAPKARTRRLVAAAAISLGAIAGGALALKPAIGPFGIHFVIDQINRGEHERLLAKLGAEAHDAADRDTLAAVRGALRDVEKAREGAPRFDPLSARSALDHYKAALRYGPLPELETTAKVALDQLDEESEQPLDRLARAAHAAATRSPEAKAELEALGDDRDARELLGEQALRDKDWAGARKIFTELERSHPASARAAFGLARAQLGLGQLPEAMAESRHVLTLSPDHVGAPILMLEVQRALQHGAAPKSGVPSATQDLVGAVNRVLKDASPGEAALAHCVLGELHASQGRTGPAQQEFEAALVVDRAMPRALIGLGEVLHQTGRDSEALARFDAAARAEPQNIAAQLGIAKSQIRLAHMAEAKAILARLSKSNPQSPEVTYWMGRAEQALGNNDAALAAYRNAIVAGKGRADSVDAYLALSKLQVDLGQLAVAQETLSEARDKLPPSGVLFKAMGEIAMSRAEYTSAHEQFQKALALDSGDTRARFLAATALTRLGRFDEALAAFQSVGQTDKDFPGLAVERGRLFEDSGRNAEALAEYEAALKKTPDDPDVQIRVGCARTVSGQTASALEILEKVAKVRTRSAEANYCLGRALFDSERYLDGMVRLERATNIDPTRAIYYLYVGWVASELGRQTDAQAAFDKAIELDKGLADAYWQRGRLRLKQGAAKDAIMDLERAYQLKPSRYDALADLAVAYADIGRMPKALDLWEEAIAKDADNPTWHFRYGKLLSSAGNGPMASAHLKRAIDLVAESQVGPASTTKPKQPLWMWQAHYLLGRELGHVPAAIPQWQAYLRLSPPDDPYRPEAERALRDLGQPWQRR